jgi:hypothetical protein
MRINCEPVTRQINGRVGKLFAFLGLGFQLVRLFRYGTVTRPVVGAYALWLPA